MRGRHAALDDTLAIFIVNVRSLAKHGNYIVCDYRCLTKDGIWFTETEMKPSDYTSKMDETIDKFLNLAYACQDDIVIMR